MTVSRRTVLGAAIALGSGVAVDATAQARGCACGRVDVHSHFLPDCYRRALAEHGITQVDGGVGLPPWSVESHLAAMVRQDVGTAMLSISSPGLHFLPAPQAVRLAREINESAAQLIAAHPGRFGAFAAVPLQDVQASIDEIAYALDVLKLDGVGLETNSRGLYLGDERYAPMFDALDRRKAVVFLHPTSPACLESVGMGYPGPLIEFPFDTTRSVVSMIFAGVFRKRRDIRLILSHAGGALPGLLSRIAMVSELPTISPRPGGGGAEVKDEVRRLYFDLALAANRPAFDALLEITDVSHILYGSDFPFAPSPAISANDRGFETIMTSLSPEHRRLVGHGNAATLFPRLGLADRWAAGSIKRESDR